MRIKKRMLLQGSIVGPALLLGLFLSLWLVQQSAAADTSTMAAYSVSAQRAKPVCGNGVCDRRETAASCPADCAPPPVCGDGLCGFEEQTTCPADCGGAICGDAVCSAGEDPTTCPADCSP